MSLAEFHFIRPYWLLAFIPYLALLVLMLRNKLGSGNWSAVCDAALLPYLLQEKPARSSRWPLTLGAIAALLAIAALAGPTWQRLPSPVFRNDSALVIALDLSRSMDAEDIKPSRLIRARYKIADMLKQRKDGQTALLVYAGDAFTVTPLTDDTETIASQLEALETGIMPSPGSNTASVLNRAVELFKQAGLQQGRIVLVTDEVDLDRALSAAEALGDYKLSVLGVGTVDGAPIAMPEGGFMKDEQGTIIVPKLNPDELARLAGAGRGVYQTLTAGDEDIKNLLANLDRPSLQQRGDAENKLLLDLWDDKGPWLLLLALPLAALWFRKGLLCMALLVLLPLPENSYALDWQDLWRTKDQQAAKAYKKGQYEQAATLFENPDWKAAAQYKAGQPVTGEMPAPVSATGFYNQGNVLAKSGRFEEAIAAYKKALELDPHNEDAEYNKKLVEKELEKQRQEQNENRENQQEQQQPPDEQQSKESPQGNNESKPSDESESGSEKKPEENAVEQKPERRQSGENQEQQNQAEEQKPDADNAGQSEQQNSNDGKPQAPERAKQENSSAQPTDEAAQANEQWLNRIPDDPAGLLKRKFQYQYDRRKQRSNDKPQAW